MSIIIIIMTFHPCNNSFSCATLRVTRPLFPRVHDSFECLSSSSSLLISCSALCTWNEWANIQIIRNRRLVRQMMMRFWRWLKQPNQVFLPRFVWVPFLSIPLIHHCIRFMCLCVCIACMNVDQNVHDARTKERERERERPDSDEEEGQRFQKGSVSVSLPSSTSSLCRWWTREKGLKEGRKKERLWAK